MGNPNMTWQRVEHRMMRQEKAGRRIGGIEQQHDWGDWGEWHYHKYPIHQFYSRGSRLIAGIGYKQRVRVCKRCRARDVERAEIYA